MPEQTNEQQGLTFEVPDRPWLERDDWYVCRVHLGGEDWVDLLAVSGELGDDLDEIIKMATNLLPENRDELGEMELIQHALEQGLSDAVWYHIDRILARYVKDWRLNDYAEQTGAKEHDPPGEWDDADQREEMLKSLPIPMLARILYGLAWHTRNFT